MKYQSAVATILVAMSTFATAMPKGGDRDVAVVVDAPAKEISSSSADDGSSTSSPIVTSSSSTAVAAVLTSSTSTLSITHSPDLFASSASVCTPKFKTFNTSSVYYTSTIIYSAITTFFPTVHLEQGCTRTPPTSTSSAEPLPTCDDKGTDIC